MERPSIDELLEQLEDARDAGRELDLEKLCAPWPELLAPLKLRWERLLQFEKRFGTDKPSDSEMTRQESTSEINQKISSMPESMQGDRLVMQTELHLDQFHDRGGLGDVYRAHDGELSREVAVKLLRADRQSSANREDFRRESHIIGRMNHPGIVAIHGAGETIDGRPFYSMPFLDGGNLRIKTAAYHREHPGTLRADEKDFRDLLYRLAAVCKTIAYAHSRGIVHRDLKAENILLGKYGETLVIDWGCAVKVDRDQKFKVFGERTMQLPGGDNTTSSGGLTLRYASPEQLHGGKPVGPESDIYSVGAILYLLLTGQSPLENLPDEKVRASVLEGGIPRPEMIKNGVPKSLAAICDKAMALKPHDRYETALEMSEDLERFLADEAVSVCRPSLGMRIARTIRRNRTASLVLLGTLLLGSFFLFLAFAGQSVFARRAEASARERLRMAASLASNVGGFEVNRRMSLLEREAANQRLVESMTVLAQTPNDRDLWSVPQTLLYEFRDQLIAANIKHESIFLNDATGKQIARAPKSDSIGKNFAYRHYFHGLKEDLDPDSEAYQSAPPGPAITPVVSNAYVSTSIDKETGEYPIKTSFSVPITYRDEQGEVIVLGRLGMSLQINDLTIFDSLKQLSLDAVLIETRDYTWGTGNASGLILDRFNTEDQTVSVPEVANNSDDVRTESQVKDSMPRLSTASLNALTAVASKEARLVPGFVDGELGNRNREAACAQLHIPYREDLTTGWMVLFIENQE